MEKKKEKKAWQLWYLFGIKFKVFSKLFTTKIILFKNEKIILQISVQLITQQVFEIYIYFTDFNNNVLKKLYYHNLKHVLLTKLRYKIKFNWNFENFDEKPSI